MNREVFVYKNGIDIVCDRLQCVVNAMGLIAADIAKDRLPKECDLADYVCNHYDIRIAEGDAPLKLRYSVKWESSLVDRVINIYNHTKRIDNLIERGEFKKLEQ